VKRDTLVACALVAVIGAAACTDPGSSANPVSSAVTTAGSATGEPTGPGSSSSTPPVVATNDALAKQVCSQTPHDVLLRTWRGVFPGRSGQIQLIPTFPNFINGGLTHSTPFDYTQEVPLLFYGPGYVKPGAYDKQVTLADLAPTTGRFVGFDFHAADGTAQSQIVLPVAAGQPLPRLVVTMVWDSGGMDVLNTWPNDWPYLHSLIPHGAWFTNATVGASPSNTPVGHATIGTGAFPNHHGMADEYISINGRMEKPNENGPAFMVEPTLADLYDRAMGNEPLIGAIATLSAHIMMMSHGTNWTGGDSDLAVTREKEDAATGGDDSAVSWNLTSDMAPFYTLPSYVNDLPGIDRYNDELDRMDGAADGRWRDNSIEQLHNGFDTPARTLFQTPLIEKVITTEGFGSDDVPDLLYVNYKAIDTIGHAFSANGVEMSDAVRVQDQSLKDFVGFLNRRVGKGKWVLALTADHGTQLDPEVSGAFMIDIDRFTQDLQQTFDDDGDDVDLFVKIRPTELWANEAELSDNGFSLNDISEYIMGLTQAQTAKTTRPPEAGHEGDTVFSAAMPSTMLSELPCLPEARPGS
jgi:hypothetical protein